MSTKKFLAFCLIAFMLLSITGCPLFPKHEIEGLVTDIKFVPSGSFGDIPRTVVYFKDGRVIIFNNITAIFQIGKIHHIVFHRDGGNIIEKITIKNDKIS